MRYYYSVEEKCFLFDSFRQTGSATQALRRYRLQFPNRQVPSRKIFYRLKKTFFETGSVKKKPVVRRKTKITEEMEINVLAYFRAFPYKSIPDILRELPISYGSVKNILKKHKFRPYKPTRVQKLTARQKEERLRFCRYMMEEIERNPNFLNSILWTDESNFSTSRGCHRRNTHHWSDANPFNIQEIQFQGRQSVSVWCGLIGDRVLNPIIFEGCLTGPRYLNMLQEEIEDRLDDLPIATLRNLLWQQDGAPPHSVAQVTEYLNAKYVQWIGKSGTIKWPPNSPDITPCDFFFWGHVKNIVYSTPCYSLDELHIRINNAVHQIQNNRNILLKIKRHIVKIFRKCIEKEGGHVEQYRL